MRAVRQESNSHKTGSEKWWETVNSITSRTKLNIPASGKIDQNDINVLFQKINIDCNYKCPNPCEIPEGMRIPSLSTNMVQQFLDKLQLIDKLSKVRLYLLSKVEEGNETISLSNSEEELPPAFDIQHNEAHLSSSLLGSSSERRKIREQQEKEFHESLL